MSRLLYRDAQGRDGGVELRDQPVYIGRAVDCAIRTDDAMVSRKHSMVSFQDGRYWIEDLESSNGTHVNDVRVKRQALAHNDVVRCGSLWLRFVEDAPKAPGPTSAFRAQAQAQGHDGHHQPPSQAGGHLASPPLPPPPPPLAAAPPQVFSPGAVGGPRAGAELGTLHVGGNDDVPSLRRQIAELQAARDQAVNQTRWLRDEVARKFKTMATELERMRAELEELMRKIGA
jgi:predicted component of type VI protein secretion system